MSRKQRLIALFAVGLPLLLADQITKYWAANWLVVQTNGSAPFWPGVVGWVYAENTGMAFSSLANFPALITICNILILAAVLVYLFVFQKFRPLGAVSLVMIFAGGLGNILDRLFYGYVVDFIHLEFMRFAIFNAADVFLCAGCGLFVLFLLLCEREERKGSSGKSNKLPH